MILLELPRQTIMDELAELELHKLAAPNDCEKFRMQGAMEALIWIMGTHKEHICNSRPNC